MKIFHILIGHLVNALHCRPEENFIIAIHCQTFCCVAYNECDFLNFDILVIWVRVKCGMLNAECRK